MYIHDVIHKTKRANFVTYALSPENDRDTAIGYIHIKFGEVWTYGFEMYQPTQTAKLL